CRLQPLYFAQKPRLLNPIRKSQISNLKSISAGCNLCILLKNPGCLTPSVNLKSQIDICRLQPLYFAQKPRLLNPLRKSQI
ncbi:hypothetical protein QUB56_21205, partial [Microcoleus sp. AR_TQ3_B6]|uniref:hypothetical protein n=1 Tax=Microcoleus sp. AR_TQ3_B6 TaxID=3055284 RepID=UPI002FD0BA26